MSPPVTEETVRAEHAQVTRLARETPDVVYVGHRTGQFAVRFRQPRDGVGSVELTRVDADAAQSAFQCVLRPADDADGPDARRVVFHHPFPVLEWLNETLPAFDLLEFVYVNDPDGPAGGA